MFLGIFLNKFFCCRTKYGHDRIFLRKKEKILIKVAVTGALGKMGREVISMTLADENLDLVLALDVVGEGEKISDKVSVRVDFENALKEIKPDVVVDFTQPDVIFEHVKKYLELGIKSVIGTTGLSLEQIEVLKKLSKENNTGVIIAPNFAIGASFFWL